MEQVAADSLSSWLTQLGLFGLGLIVIGAFVWLWLRESRAVRADTETIVARKDKEISDLKAELLKSKTTERETYEKYMACLYQPKNGGVKDG